VVSSSRGVGDVGDVGDISTLPVLVDEFQTRKIGERGKQREDVVAVEISPTSPTSPMRL
jgi:hypothetical protein